jgi:hypothetical protein
MVTRHMRSPDGCQLSHIGTRRPVLPFPLITGASVHPIGQRHSMHVQCPMNVRLPSSAAERTPQ